MLYSYCLQLSRIVNKNGLMVILVWLLVFSSCLRNKGDQVNDLIVYHAINRQIQKCNEQYLLCIRSFVRVHLQVSYH